MNAHELTYTYTGNQLQTVTDATNNPDGFNDGNTTGADFVYDTFGNITQDKNKGITAVKYNHLNLPTEIIFTSGKINYIYDAAGTRLSKKVQPNGDALVTTDYVNGFQYENNNLKFFHQPEGFVEYKNNQYIYNYLYKDHLGNNRLVYADLDGNGTINPATEIVEENNYYPFGLKHKGYNELATENPSGFKYKFNGQEWQNELGLNVYDYDNRVYDPTIGRFYQTDPKGELGRRWSPYNYCFNNPIYFQDPDGMWPWPSWAQFKSFASGVNSGVKNFVPNAVNHAKSEVKGLVNAYKNIATNPRETLKYAANHSGPVLLYNITKSQVETPVAIISNVSEGNYKAAGEIYGNHLATGATILATDGALKAVSKRTGKTSVVETPKIEAPVTNEIYSRPNNATTPAQRASVQNQNCVDCGGVSEPMVADHKRPLVKEHYETGTINKEAMRSLDAVQPQCTSCSAKQGAEMSKYSRQMKAIIKERTSE